METKSFYESRTFWGGAAAVVTGALGLLGYGVGEGFEDAFVGLGLSAGGLVGGALAIYGRFRATTALVVKK